jgi:hypothetical protein
MKPSEIKMVPIDKIVANPFRDLANYPVIRSKVDTLKASIATVGMWESIIARPKDNHYEQAFGHQRLTAAKEMKLTEVPVIVRDLTDEQMVQFMGRENGEDYSADFLVMLNTWEAGVKFSGSVRKNLKAVDIARLLGWMEMKGSTGQDQMNQIARACAGAVALIEGGYIERKDLDGLTVSAARHIVERALSRMDSISKMGKLSGAEAKDIEHAKTMVGRGVKETVKEAKKGTVPASQIGSRVDVNTMRAAGRSKEKATPLFDAFGHKLATDLRKVLESDGAADRLNEIAKALKYVTDEGDKVILRRIDYELSELGARADRWRKRLTPKNIQSFPAQSQIGGPRNG